MSDRYPKLCGPRADGRYYATDPHTHKPVYFGREKSAARALYNQWVADLATRRAAEARRPEPAPYLHPVQHEPLVGEILADYLDYADRYYRKNGKPTSEPNVLRQAFRFAAPFLKFRAADFGSRELKAIRTAMMDHASIRTGQSLGRNHINKQIGRIIRAFRWALEDERVPAEVVVRLQAVKPLEFGRFGVREEEDVESVPIELIERTIPHLPKRTQTIVRLHLAMGCRACEVVIIRPCDVDRTQVPWRYMPSSHKTQHKKKSRVIYLGPSARELLAPFLDACRTPEDFAFRSRGRGRNFGKGPGHLTVWGYRKAIWSACRREKLEPWCPRQIRHTALTLIRSRHGIEAAQVIGGHADSATTLIYAARSEELAARVAEEMG